MRVISGTARGTVLYSLDGDTTRPTLDRVKESLFNIIQNNIKDTNVLDLFAGSGALGIETLSRGANRVVFCDISSKAIEIVKKNIQKTHLENKSEVIKENYIKALEILKYKNKFDLIFIDPPYDKNIAVDAIKNIIQKDLLSANGIIILETDNESRELKQLEDIDINIYDLRKYGRVKLIFLNRKG